MKFFRKMGGTSSKGKAKGGYPKQEGYDGPPAVTHHQPEYQPQVHHQKPYLPPGADNVDRQDSACQKQFNPGDETYRCIDCELTDDTPGKRVFINLALTR